MKKNGFFALTIIVVLFSAFACGLKYTPVKTNETSQLTRQSKASDYITESYKDSVITYHSISFAQPTIVKPYAYEQLDSLYDVKFNNELRGKFDKVLEEKIANQKIVIQNSSQKIQYIEHHVYAMQKPITSYIYFSDIIFDNNGNVINYSNSTSYEIPTNKLAIFKSFITGESLIQQGYSASEGERKIYNSLLQEMDKTPALNKNEYAIQMTNILSIIKQTKSVDIKVILKNLAVLNIEGRMFNQSTDKLIRADGLYQEEELMGYEVEIQLPTGNAILLYKPSFDLMD